MECAEAVLKKWHVKTIVKKIKSFLSVFADYGEAMEHIRQAVINQSPFIRSADNEDYVKHGMGGLLSALSAALAGSDSLPLEEMS